MTALFTIQLATNQNKLARLGPLVRNYRRGLIASGGPTAYQQRERLKMHRGSCRMVRQNQYSMRIVSCIAYF